MNIEVHVGRCSACNKQFHLVPTTGTATCPHCNEAYFFHNGSWQNEKLRVFILERDGGGPQPTSGAPATV